MKIIKANKIYVSIMIFIGWIIVFSIYSYSDHKKELMSSLDKRLEIVAVNFDKIIPKGFHHKNLTKNSITKEQDLALAKKFNQYAISNNVYYVYAMILKDNKIYFTASSATDEELKENDGGFFYYPYDDAAPYVYDAFKNKEVTFHNVKDQWGEFRSVFVPHVADDGTVYVIGADVTVKYIAALLKKELLKSQVISLIFILSAVPFFLVYRSQARRNAQILKNQIALTEKASNAKSEFLSSMSHELRTPLNVILGFSQLIEMTEKDEAKKRNVGEIIHAGSHLLDLINEVLDLSKIESDSLKLTIGSHSLNTIINNALRLIRPLADKHTIQLNDKICSLPDFNIAVDDMRFKQIMINLMSNAIKYNRENGTVTIERSLTEEHMLELSITDTGKGLTPEQQQRIFEPFERLDAEKTDVEGTGLGLVIAKNLIEMMDGTIDVESELGEGCRFRITVPLS